MYLFYAPDIAKEYVLPEEESKHAVRVLRLQSGDEIDVVDGAGSYYKARITNPNPKRCEFSVYETIANFGVRPYRLHIAIAPTKNIERLEWFIEKCTEIGIDEITPILCRYSERKQVKAERLEKIVISAAKQSLKAGFPKLNPLCSVDELLKKPFVGQKFIAHCYDLEKTSLKMACRPAYETLILIGPEGDFSAEEVERAIQNDFIPVSLGSSRLRTETAGIVACHTVALANE